eukprot:Nk52_evm9s96 gene=Nk52_evmTU9s96
MKKSIFFTLSVLLLVYFITALPLDTTSETDETQFSGVTPTNDFDQNPEPNVDINLSSDPTRTVVNENYVGFDTPPTYIDPDLTTVVAYFGPLDSSRAEMRTWLMGFDQNAKQDSARPFQRPLT